MPRRSISEANGFTFVEVLVVVLLVGILVLIALPSFLGQRARAQDSEAHAMIRTAQVALATYETDRDTFNATRAALQAIEPAIGEATSGFDVSGSTTTYTITEHSVSGTDFTLRRDGSGTITRTCTVPSRGLCKSDSRW